MGFPSSPHRCFFCAMAVLFISDLHLCASRPEINGLFLDFLRGPARGAESLYILGDLFEYWAGDDDLGDPFNDSIVSALAECSRAGPALHVMRGHADFLLDGALAAACNAPLISDRRSVDRCRPGTLLMHGDTVCTDARDYPRCRARARAPTRRKGLPALPLAQRKQQIEALRATSQSEKKRKAPALMDVNEAA